MFPALSSYLIFPCHMSHTCVFSSIQTLNSLIYYSLLSYSLLTLFFPSCRSFLVGRVRSTLVVRASAPIPLQLQAMGAWMTLQLYLFCLALYLGVGSILRGTKLRITNSNASWGFPLVVAYVMRGCALRCMMFELAWYTWDDGQYRLVQDVMFLPFSLTPYPCTCHGSKDKARVQGRLY